MQVTSIALLKVWLKGRKSVRAPDVPAPDKKEVARWLHKLWVKRTLSTRSWDREAGEYVYTL